jgi:predicted HTH transcriptional regulator
MNLSTEQILDMIRLGEDSGIEFKEARFSGERVTDPTKDRLAKEIAAMANAKGGWLILGVEDKKRLILGIPLDRLDSLERFVGEICMDTLKPPLPVDMFRRELPNEAGDLVPVLLVRIEKSLYVHQAPDGFFYRVGSRAQPMATDFVLRLYQERSLAKIKRFEELPVPRSSAADLSESLWRRFVSNREENSETALLKRDLLVVNTDGDTQASVLGVLMCSENPRRFFPNAFIQAVRYRGMVQDSNFQVDAKNISGPLDRQIVDALVFMRLNQRIAAVKEIGRSDHPQFSERAVFEAIVNAVAHRDYSIEHSKIRFFIFDDRLEIYSPGALVNSMSVESLSLRTATRNERITNLLAECSIAETFDDLGRTSMMERRGDGVDIILSESEKLSGKRPEYRVLDDSEVMLTIFAANLPNQDE